ncbi:uncharacterized protein EI90DRAFT_1091566 [Cantharellus anzutake]|uniref:uncharacterized protein n=1 Tax=Cantharellus anzutake TaxID=1750568 RepID=UPI001905DADE|nr:uncharacterized protein EI90DRAFT_1091566 [Cantharellus anzutake]KAF8330747.1 hypothetical protein EI90DRAFT_1091566 [Cantharellus anzutake]
MELGSKGLGGWGSTITIMPVEEVYCGRPILLSRTLAWGLAHGVYSCSHRHQCIPKTLALLPHRGFNSIVVCRERLAALWAPAHGIYSRLIKYPAELGYFYLPCCQVLILGTSGSLALSPTSFGLSRPCRHCCTKVFKTPLLMPVILDRLHGA